MLRDEGRLRGDAVLDEVPAELVQEARVGARGLALDLELHAEAVQLGARRPAIGRVWRGGISMRLRQEPHILLEAAMSYPVSRRLPCDTPCHSLHGDLAAKPSPCPPRILSS